METSMSTSWPRPSNGYAGYVRKLMHCGHWVLRGRDSRQHVVLEHVESGQTIAYATHQGGNDRNSARNFAAEAQRICGCKLIEPRGRKRSHKRPQLSGFSISDARRESMTYHQLWDEQIENLHKTRARLIEHARELAKDRGQLRHIPELLKRIASIEQQLVDDFHQPIERFDPYTLND